MYKCVDCVSRVSVLSVLLSGQMLSKTTLISLSIFRFGGEKSVHGRPSWELAPYDCSSQNTVSEDFAAWCKLVSKELRFNYLIALESAEWFAFKSRLSLIVR